MYNIFTVPIAEVWPRFVSEFPSLVVNVKIVSIIIDSLEKLSGVYIHKDDPHHGYWEDFYSLPLHCQIFTQFINSQLITTDEYQEYLELADDISKIATVCVLSKIDLFEVPCGLAESINFDNLKPEDIKVLIDKWEAKDMIIRYAMKSYNYELYQHLVLNHKVGIYDVMDYLDEKNYMNALRLLHNRDSFYDDLIIAYEDANLTLVLKYIAIVSGRSVTEVCDHYCKKLA